MLNKVKKDNLYNKEKLLKINVQTESKTKKWDFISQAPVGGPTKNWFSINVA